MASKFKFSKRSLKNLEGVHPDLVKVVHRALEISTIDFMVTEGVRTITRQQTLLNMGASKTMKSRHLTGHAVDIAALLGKDIRWDWPLYERLATVFKTAAVDVGVTIEWGGDWKTFRDGPHYQLPWREYPI